MPIKPQNRKPRRTLLSMLAITVALIAILGATTIWGGDNASWAPKLGLDLEGGQQVILEPQVREGETVNQEQLSQAVDIMRARVDGQGVAEAEVATLGDQVTVTVPGRMSQAQLNSLQQSSQMRFRPVILAAPTEQAPADTIPESLPPSLPSGSATPSGSARPSAPASAPPGSATTERGVIPQALQRHPAADATTPGSTGTQGGAGSTAGSGGASAAPSAAATPTISDEDAQDTKKLITYATSEAWATPQYLQQLQEYDCRNQPVYSAAAEDLMKPRIACESDGSVKYLLGPSVLVGSEIADATSAPATNQQGQPTGGYEVNLRTTGEATAKYAEISRFMVPLQQPRNQLAVVLDNSVVSAPRFESAIPDGSARISGDFTQETAQLLANQLKFGALPMSFQFQSNQDISPTLGGDQLQKGLIAGLIGMLLVVVYSLMQYRALGLVTVASLILVAILTYLTLTILGWSHNLRLTMAGVTGAIVAIGTTADSFIVYFERIRDELREGRSLFTAAEVGWLRARRTLLISDGVNFLAALVLYVLASSNVRGFAFMLMLTTILDVLVTFLFTHPLVSMLSTTRFFGGGHRWSGLDPERLGVKTVRYRGRGQFAVGGRPAAEKGQRPAGASPEGSLA